ncbi:MAG: hypothetical protein ACLUIE_16540 [Parabacteroides merdae]
MNAKKYYDNRTYPIDIHCQQSARNAARLYKIKEYKEIAEKAGLIDHPQYVTERLAFTTS